jgi:DNA-binding transcriptional LysR family regulator
VARGGAGAGLSRRVREPPRDLRAPLSEPLPEPISKPHSEPIPAPAMSRRVDAFSLRLFVSAARAGSLVRGAQQEHIAPSALSRRIADLEHAFGAPLLVRSPRGIALTEAGRLVLARGEQIDADLQGLVREVQSLGDEVRGTVRLHANVSAVIGFLPERLQPFMAAHPKVTVALREDDTRDVLRACLDDRADVGVGVALPVPAGLDAWAFATDALRVLMPAGHALARAGTGALDFARVLAQPLIGVHRGGALDRTLHRHAEALGLDFAPKVSVSSFDAVCRMVEAGLGIAVIPASAACAYAGHPRFERLPLDEPWAERRLSVYAPRKTPRSRAVEALIDALRLEG